MVFSTGEIGHILSVMFFLTIIAIIILMGKYFKDNNKEQKFIRYFSILSSIFWLYMQYWYLKPENFDPYVSYPLHVCDILVPISILTLLSNNKWLKSILYYWGIVFTFQAFITPSSDLGPSYIRYWLFWVSHSIIIFSVIYLLLISKYKASIGDLIKAFVSICIYAILITPINIIKNWNYGYIGNNMPESPSVLDLLGSWPRRVILMFLLVILLFFIITIPFIIEKHIKYGREEK